MVHRIQLLLLFASLMLIGAPVLVGVDSDGKCLTLGSGWHGTTARHAPVVADNGLVTFIAPDYEEATSVSQAESYCAVYQAQTIDAVPKSSLLYSGFDSSLYEISIIAGLSYPKAAFGIRHFELVACGNTFARLVREFKGILDDSGVFARGTSLKFNSKTKAISSEDIISGLAVSGNGQLAIVHNTQNKSYLLFSLAGGNIQEQTTSIPSGNGRACPNPDGSAIWLVSNAGLAGQAAGPLRLYRYQLSTKKTTFLATLEDTGDTSFGLTDAQLVAASNAEAVALVSNNAALWGGTPTVASVGRQVLLATLDSNDNVTFTRCGNHYKGGSPAISSDGRFVAFTAAPKPSSDDVQIFRYDTETANLEQASGDANRDCVCPAISPSGRFMAFVSNASNLGAGNNHPNVYGLDLGCTLTSAESFKAYVGLEATLPIKCSGTLPSDSITLDWTGNLPGTLKNAQGAIVTQGKPFAASLLPLHYAADDKGTTELTATLSNGQTATLTLYSSLLGTPTTQLASAKEDGSILDNGGFRNDGSFAFSADGSIILFSTTAPLTSDDIDFAQDAYAYHLPTGQLTRLTSGLDNAQYFAFSADGTTCAALVQDEIHVFAGGKLIATIAEAGSAPALNNDGSAIAFIGTDGAPKLYTKSTLTTLAVPGASICSNPWISADGTAVACLQDGLLLLWKTPDGEPVTVGTDVTSFSATADASQFLVCNTNSCTLRASTGKLLRIISDLTSVNKPVLAANGRFVAFYKRPDDSTPYQLYRRDLITGKSMDTLLSATSDGDYLNSTANPLPPAISADGVSVAYATRATNLVEGKESPYSLELYVAYIKLQASTLWQNATTATSGWTLLSTPIAIYAEELNQIFGTPPWFWQDDGWTQETGKIIPAGTGFLVWQAGAPHDLTVSSMGDHPPRTMTGWNLLGPSLGEEKNFIQAGFFSWDNDASTWIATPPGDAIIGTAYWYFVR